MKITPKFTFVSGSFDTDEVKMLCLRKSKSLSKPYLN